MASVSAPGPTYPRAGAVSLAWAFVERQKNLWKRYWAWEVVWLVYGVVNTLAITFIAEEAGQQGAISQQEVQELVLFLQRLGPGGAGGLRGRPDRVRPRPGSA